jgi:hypothetical protein
MDQSLSQMQRCFTKKNPVPHKRDDKAKGKRKGERLHPPLQIVKNNNGKTDRYKKYCGIAVAKTRHFRGQLQSQSGTFLYVSPKGTAAVEASNQFSGSGWPTVFRTIQAVW